MWRCCRLLENSSNSTRNIRIRKSTHEHVNIFNEFDLRQCNCCWKMPWQFYVRCCYCFNYLLPIYHLVSLLFRHVLGVLAAFLPFFCTLPKYILQHTYICMYSIANCKWHTIKQQRRTKKRRWRQKAIFIANRNECAILFA